MPDFPVNVADKVECEKCKYRYKSLITVFAVKNIKYEAKCPQCSHVNKRELSRESIKRALGEENEQGKGVEKNKAAKSPGVFQRSDIKGLYLAVGAVCAYMLGWIIGWVAGSADIDRFAIFLQKLSYPVFALGITLLLFAIATKKNDN